MRITDMPGLPTNAPTTGVAAVNFWTLAGIMLVAFVVLAALVAIVRVLFPTGEQKLNFRRASDSIAITVLQTQVQSLQAKIEALELRVAKQDAEEEYNREYRHALANRATALSARAELTDTIFSTILETWKECPELIRRQIAQVKSVKQIGDDFPIPEPLLHSGVMVG